MWELDYKESWAPKNWCFWTVLEKTPESPLDCKEIQPVNPKGNQSWVFIGRTDAEAETPILWPPDAKNQLIGKDPDTRKDRRREKMTEYATDMNLSKFWELVTDREAWRASVHGVPKNWTWLGDWTTTIMFLVKWRWRVWDAAGVWSFKWASATSRSQMHHWSRWSSASLCEPPVETSQILPLGTELHSPFLPPSKFTHWGPKPQYFRMWPYLERRFLLRRSH